MKEKYVILRESSSRRRGPVAGPAGTAQTQPGLEVEIDELDRRASRAVAAKRDVKAVAPVIPMRLITPVPRPEDTAQPAGGTAWGITAVKADASSFDGSDVIVAVLDTGIAKNHPAFAGVTIDEQDFTGEGNGDTHGHGTHCAGTIFGRDVDGTRIGVARGVKKALIGKVLGGEGGGSDAIVRAINWAVEEGANVISMSLGIDFPGFVEFLVTNQGLPIDLATTTALEGYRQNVLLFERLASLVRAREAFGETTLIVAAAGNESRRDENADFEIAVQSAGGVRGAHLGGGARPQQRQVRRRALQQHQRAGLRARRGHPVGEAQRRPRVDERHEHGDAARGRRGGAVDAAAGAGRPRARIAAEGETHRVGDPGRHHRRVRHRRRRLRHGAVAPRMR